MNNKNKKIAYIAVVAALYAALTYAQSFLLPGTTTMPYHSKKQLQTMSAAAFLVFHVFSLRAL